MKDEQMLEWFKHVIWAGRSVEDRLLGMEKAVGSNPIRSIFFLIGEKLRLYLSTGMNKKYY